MHTAPNNHLLPASTFVRLDSARTQEGFDRMLGRHILSGVVACLSGFADAAQRATITENVQRHGGEVLLLLYYSRA